MSLSRAPYGSLVLPLCALIAGGCGETPSTGDDSSQAGAESANSNDVPGPTATVDMADDDLANGPVVDAPTNNDPLLAPPDEDDLKPVEPPEVTDENKCAGIERKPEEVEVEVPMERVVTTEVLAPIAFYIVLDNSLSMDEPLPGFENGNGQDFPVQQPMPPADDDEDAEPPQQQTVIGDGGAPEPQPEPQPEPVAEPDAPTTRWELAVQSLTEFAYSPDSEGIDIALQYFNPNGGGSGFPTQPAAGGPDLCDGVWHSMPDVPVTRLPEGADAIAQSLQAAAPTGFTPTVGALAGGVAFCEQFQAANPDQDCVVVLVTDGLPRSCGLCEDGGGGTDCYDPMSPDLLLPLAQAGTAAQVRTFTVGMDGVPAQGFELLDAIAVAGGTDCTPDVPGEEACNVSSAGPQGLVEALTAIRDSVTVTETFTEVTTVIETTVLECQWRIPEPDTDEELDPRRVNVTLSLGGGEPDFIGSVETEADCATTGGLGWYYDNPEQPTMIFACPESCKAIQEGSEPVVEIQLGCAQVRQPEIAK